MRLQGIKIRLTVLIGSLLVLSMLLVNFVLIIFWQRDALQRDVGRDLAVLGQLQQSLPGDVPAFHELSPQFFEFADFYAKGETGRILVLSGEDDPVVSSRSEAYLPLLARTIAEAIENNCPVLHYSGFFLGLFQFRSHVLVTAEPVIRKGEVIGGIGIERKRGQIFILDNMATN